MLVFFKIGFIFLVVEFVELDVWFFYKFVVVELDNMLVEVNFENVIDCFEVFIYVFILVVVSMMLMVIEF